MRQEDFEFLQKILTIEKINNPVLEIGSKVTFDASPFIVDMKTTFKDFEFYGVDLEMGETVDILANAEYLPFRTNSIGTLLCIGTMEHIKRFWLAMEEFYRVLKKGCYIFIATVFAFPIHTKFDYWRFSPDGLAYLMERFDDKIIVGENFGISLDMIPEEQKNLLKMSLPVGIYASGRKQ